MQALVLTRSIPQPGVFSGHRAFFLLQLLRQIGFETHLVCPLQTDQSLTQADHLRGICRYLHVFPPATGTRWKAARAWMRFGSYLQVREQQAAMADKVRELLPKVNLVVSLDALYDGLLNLPEASAEYDASSGRPFYLLDLAEPLSARLVTRATSCGGLGAWALRAEAKAIRKLEYQAARRADLTLLSSRIDLEMLHETCRHSKLWFVGNGVDLGTEIKVADFEALRDAMLFCGDWRIAAHNRAAIWFAQKVLPTIRRRRPGVTLHLAGHHPPREILALQGDERVQVHDLTAGEQPLSVLQSQCVLGVAPQRQARGATEPTLAMMAGGRPVVCTSAVMSTLPGEWTDAPPVANVAVEYTETVTNLLEDRGKAHRMGLRCRQLVGAQASWAQQWSRLAVTLSRVMRQEPVRIVSDLERRPVYPEDPQAPPLLHHINARDLAV